tara:strand:- start:279 stop:617 length:339 start_codon:yes stop_codon:yes gene_type:complete
VKFNKRDIIQRLIIIPDKGRRPFWAKQMAILNKLLVKFPKEEFWQKTSFPKKYEGMEYLLSSYGLKFLTQKYQEFNYQIPKPPTIVFADRKLGEAPSFKHKPANLRQFLQDD